MAKPITPTPRVTGDAARRIFVEVNRGTPDTPKRVETIHHAREIYKTAQRRPTPQEK